MFVMLFCLGGLVFSYMNCGGGIVLERKDQLSSIGNSGDTISGNPIVTFAANPYSGNIQNLEICIGGLEITTVDGGVTLPGDHTVKLLSKQNQVLLTSGAIPTGSYSRVALHLRDECSAGYAFRFANSTGTIAVVSDATMTFNGTQQIESDYAMSLTFNAFAAGYGSVTTAGDAEVVTSSTEGAFE